MSGKIFVISAPSGTGKTTLVYELLRQWNNEHQLKRSITYTTRSARSDESEGKEYYFITVDDFKKKKEEGFFLEWSEFCGNFYGSAKSMVNEVKNNDVSFLLIIDRNGGHALRNSSEVVLIWIMPPSLKELKKRLAQRNKDSLQDQTKRLEKAKKELREEKEEHLYDYHIVNDDFLSTVQKLKSLIEGVLAQKNNRCNKGK